MKRSKQAYVVLMMDIDFFKRVNDTYGHDMGDAVLKHMSSLIRASIRESDFCARTGGEEFLALLPMTELVQGVHVAEKIRRAVETSPLDPVGKVTLSIGVHAASVEDADPNEAVRNADEWLYKAKAGGRNRVCSNLSAVRDSPA